MSMTIVKTVIITFILIGSLSGCNKPITNESMFEVGVDEIMDIQVNQSFKIIGFIKNNSNKSWEITHGAGMFTYQIFDEEGNLIPQESSFLFRNDIGYLKAWEPGEEYRNNGEEHRSKEFYEFTIHKPGKYKVMTVVNFRIKNEQTNDEKEMTSDFYEFLVK